VASQAKPAKPPTPVDYTRLQTTNVLDFRYSFPTVVGTYPSLLAKIRSDRDAVYRDALKDAASDAAMRGDKDFPFHRHELFRDWTVAGNTSRLLSLESHSDNFTGGAHGNHWTTLLLWDEKRGVEVKVDQLFGGGAVLWKHLQPDYCRKLNLERRRRGFPDSVGCPERKELTIVPVDSDLNWALDSLRVVADPYVAGSYAEGTYVISTPITPALLKLVEPEFRGDFEVQRQ
jgi:hypothetical protein